MADNRGTFTITFGDRVENHLGMEQIGELADTGFTCGELEEAQKKFESIGAECEYFRLKDYATEYLRNVPAINEAGLLIVRDAVDLILNDVKKEALFEEQYALSYDKKAFMYGRVVNKHARYNVCYGNDHREPDYPNKKGTIISFDETPILARIRHALPDFIGPKAIGLLAEGNYYHDTNTCGIGYHGDAERKKVIGIRLGQDLRLCFHWYHNGERVGEKASFILRSGDLYIMSEKTTGFDFKSKTIPTLRHAAGCDKYTQ